MGVVYGLFSTRDGLVRYVGQTEYTARKRLDLIVTKALDHESGALYDWVRTEWRSGAEVRAYVLQDDIIPADLELFERYWIEQFAGLLNASSQIEGPWTTSGTGKRVNASILKDIKGT
jgi:hypothetical protein